MRRFGRVSLLPRRRFARCAMWRYASSHACRPSAAAWPSNSPPSATAEAGGATVVYRTSIAAWPGARVGSILLFDRRARGGRAIPLAA
jgi:hypothetical protein